MTTHYEIETAVSTKECWDTLIRDAIIGLEPRYTPDRPSLPEQSVALAELRPVLDTRGMSRALQDAHLKRLSNERRVHLAPESCRKALRKRDHAAAIRVGHEDSHWVSWIGER